MRRLRIVCGISLGYTLCLCGSAQFGLPPHGALQAQSQFAQEVGHLPVAQTVAAAEEPLSMAVAQVSPQDANGADTGGPPANTIQPKVNVNSAYTSPVKRLFAGLRLTPLQEIVRLRQQKIASEKKSEPTPAGVELPPFNASEVVVSEEEERRREAMWSRAVQRRKVRGELINAQSQSAMLSKEAERFRQTIRQELAEYEAELRGEYVVRTQIDYLGRYISVVEPRYTAAQIRGFLSARERELNAQLFAYQRQIAKIQQQIKQLQSELARLRAAPSGNGS